MKKHLFIGMMVLLPLIFAPVKSYALPLFVGTEVYTLPGDTVTMNWNVYASGTSPYGSAGAGFVYEYILNTATGSLATYDINAFVGFSSTTGAGFVNGADLTNVAQNPAGANPGPVGILKATFISSGAAGDTAVAWWSSAVGPTTAQVDINGVANTGIVLAPNTLGSPPPGVPEPQTWALLLALMGFSTWWMRRRRNEETWEASIAA